MREKTRNINRRTDRITRKLAVTGALVALDVVFSRVFAINTSVMKIGFGFLAVALCGSVYGPLWGAACGALGDLAGALLFPTGAYFPGFTLTAALSGVIFGVFLRERDSAGSMTGNIGENKKTDSGRTFMSPDRICPGISGILRIRIKRAAAAVLDTVLVVYFGNTLMISYLTGTAYGKLLAARAVQLAVMLPVECVFLLILLPMILSRLKVIMRTLN